MFAAIFVVLVLAIGYGAYRYFKSPVVASDVNKDLASLEAKVQSSTAAVESKVDQVTGKSGS